MEEREEASRTRMRRLSALGEEGDGPASVPSMAEARGGTRADRTCMRPLSACFRKPGLLWLVGAVPWFTMLREQRSL